METIEDDASSYTTSSSTETAKPRATNHPKRKAGRKKFKETRHPVYRGVRLRNGTKWVCEVREPNKKSRIWLGTFPTPEMAARAYDAATLTLRGDNSPLNFVDSARLIKRAKSTSVRDIQEAALETARAFGPKCQDETWSPPAASSSMETVAEYVDEEVLFNMPSYYNSMAEGLVITPPGMKKGFDWSSSIDDHDDFQYSNIDTTLWRY